MSLLKLLLAFAPWLSFLIIARGSLFNLKLGLTVALVLSVVMGVARLHRQRGAPRKLRQRPLQPLGAFLDREQRPVGPLVERLEADAASVSERPTASGGIE